VFAVLQKYVKVDNLLDTYGGEPSDEDMGDARVYLEETLTSLRKKLGSVEKRSAEKPRNSQETLWKSS
jgi:hypothetical protein